MSGLNERMTDRVLETRECRGAASRGARWEWSAGQKCPLGTELWFRTMDGAPSHGACLRLLILRIPGDGKRVVPLTLGIYNRPQNTGTTKALGSIAPAQASFCALPVTRSLNSHSIGRSRFRSALSSCGLRGRPIPGQLWSRRSHWGGGCQGSWAVAMEREVMGVCYSNLITCLARGSK